MIAGIELPFFSSDIQDYWEFRRAFRALINTDWTECELYMLQLRGRLQKKETKNMLKGVTEVAKAWQILDEHYGNRHAAIVTVIAGLRNCTLTGTTSHSKLECLAQLVPKACSSLRQVHAKHCLASEFSLIRLLASKLPGLYVDKWDGFVADYDR